MYDPYQWQGALKMDTKTAKMRQVQLNAANQTKPSQTKAKQSKRIGYFVRTSFKTIKKHTNMK